MPLLLGTDANAGNPCIPLHTPPSSIRGVGIAQWLEHQKLRTFNDEAGGERDGTGYVCGCADVAALLLSCHSLKHDDAVAVHQLGGGGELLAAHPGQEPVSLWSALSASVSLRQIHPCILSVSESTDQSGCASLNCYLIESLKLFI